MKREFRMIQPRPSRTGWQPSSRVHRRKTPEAPPWVVYLGIASFVVFTLAWLSVLVLELMLGRFP